MKKNGFSGKFHLIEVISKVRQNLAEKRLLMSVATQLVLRSFSEGGRIITENAPFADRNKNFLTFLKTFELMR